jgi:hypothetical protein
MKRVFKWTLMTVGIAAAVVLLSLPWLATHHIVRTAKGTVIVARRYVGFADTRVDIRGWTWETMRQHADLRDALASAGYAELLPRPQGWRRLGESMRQVGRHTGQAFAAGSQWAAMRTAQGVAWLDRRLYGQR